MQFHVSIVSRASSSTIWPTNLAGGPHLEAALIDGDMQTNFALAEEAAAHGESRKIGPIET